MISGTSSKTIPNAKNAQRTEEFNTFFANNGKNAIELTQKSLLNNELTCPEFSPQDCDKRNDIFQPQPVDATTVIQTIKSLREIWSVGCDGISLRFIRDSLYIIAFYLTVIMNTSLTTHAMVVPLFKKKVIRKIRATTGQYPFYLFCPRL